MEIQYQLLLYNSEEDIEEGRIALELLVNSSEGVIPRKGEGIKLVKGMESIDQRVREGDLDSVVSQGSTHYEVVMILHECLTNDFRNAEGAIPQVRAVKRYEE